MTPPKVVGPVPAMVSALVPVDVLFRYTVPSVNPLPPVMLLVKVLEPLSVIVPKVRLWAPEMVVPEFSVTALVRVGVRRR